MRRASGCAVVSCSPSLFFFHNAFPNSCVSDGALIPVSSRVQRSFAGPRMRQEVSPDLVIWEMTYLSLFQGMLDFMLLLFIL